MAERIYQSDAGLAGFEREGFYEVQLITGNPPTVDTSEEVSSDALSDGKLPAYSVVGRNGDDKLVLADGDEVKVIGVTAFTAYEGEDSDKFEMPADAPSGAVVAVWRDGTFNPEALNWHEDLEDDFDKQKQAVEDGTHNGVYVRQNPYTPEA